MGHPGRFVFPRRDAVRIGYASYISYDIIATAYELWDLGFARYRICKILKLPTATLHTILNKRAVWEPLATKRALALIARKLQDPGLTTAQARQLKLYIACHELSRALGADEPIPIHKLEKWLKHISFLRGEVETRAEHRVKGQIGPTTYEEHLTQILQIPGGDGHSALSRDAARLPRHADGDDRLPGPPRRAGLERDAGIGEATPGFAVADPQDGGGDAIDSAPRDNHPADAGDLVRNPTTGVGSKESPAGADQAGLPGRRADPERTPA